MRTWEDNKTAIHELWPQHEFTGEEAKLWREDLAHLDQHMLYDAIRNVKRKRDTYWVQLPWITGEYRELRQARSRGSKKIHRGEKLNLQIDRDKEKKLDEQLKALIDISTPSDYQEIYKKITVEYLDYLHGKTALKLIAYAKKRFCLQDYPGFGQVNGDGDIDPIEPNLGA